MAYGLSLKRTSDDSSVDKNLIFYPTIRGGISTSDAYYFELINFQTNQIKVSFDQFGNLIGIGGIPYSSSINLDLNKYFFYGEGTNNSRPTIVEICSIDAYETGLAKTVFGNWNIGSKVIQNYSNPSTIFDVISSNPYGVQTSTFALSLELNNNTFGYVSFNNINISKIFLATLDGNWLELPDENFFYDIKYYLTTISFNGSILNFSIFNGLRPGLGETILINNANSDDTLSGLYVIDKISNFIYLSKSSIVYNFPGQTFVADINLDTSTAINKNSACYFVSYAYSTPAKCFTKPLKLLMYVQDSNPINNFVFMQKDSYAKSSLLLGLNKKSTYVKNSDSFMLGVAASTWCPDSTLFGVTLNVDIDEGS